MADDDVITELNLTSPPPIYQFNISDVKSSECYVTTKEDFENLDVFHFWFGGCLSLVIAVPGFFGNIGAAYVLSQKGENKTFMQHQVEHHSLRVIHNWNELVNKRIYLKYYSSMAMGKAAV